MNKKLSIVLIIILIIFTLIFLFNLSKTKEVYPHYTTPHIQRVIDTLEDGQTMIFHEGTYTITDQLYFYKKNNIRVVAEENVMITRPERYRNRLLQNYDNSDLIFVNTTNINIGDGIVILPQDSLTDILDSNMTYFDWKETRKVIEIINSTTIKLEAPFGRAYNSKNLSKGSTLTNIFPMIQFVYCNNIILDNFNINGHNEESLGDEIKTDQAGKGLRLRNINNSTISNNIINSTTMSSIYLYGSKNNIIKNNTVIRSNKFGIHVSGSSLNIIEDNLILNTHESPYEQPQNVDFEQTKGSGIFLCANNKQNIIRNNFIINNINGISGFGNYKNLNFGDRNNQIINNTIINTTNFAISATHVPNWDSTGQYYIDEGGAGDTLISDNKILNNNCQHEAIFLDEPYNTIIRNNTIQTQGCKLKKQILIINSVDTILSKNVYNFN